MSPIQNPDTAASEANSSKRSPDLRLCGLVLLSCSGAVFLGFVLSSGLRVNDVWTPAAIAISSSLIPPFLISGLLLVVLSLSAFANRVRRIAIAGMLLLLTFVWYPLSGHDALLMFLYSREQAFLLAEKRYCAFPIIDL